MKVKITYRCDNEEYFCTDSNIIEVPSWQAVLNEIESIEAHNTVLLVQRILDEPIIETC